MTRRTHTTRARPAFALALVLWAIAMAAIIIVGLEAASYRAASAGRETLARIRATWAARAGIEAVIARLQSETQQTEPVGGTSLLAALATVCEGQLLSTSYAVVRSTPAGLQPGVSDAHAKINVNLMTYDDLMLLPGMTEEVADAIIEWTSVSDAEDPEAEAATDDYLGMPIPYTMRRGPIRHLAELELVSGVRPEDVRGLDRNLNGIIEQSELLLGGRAGASAVATGGQGDFGWSGYITASTVESDLDAFGQPRLDLATAQASDVISVADVSDAQAQVIIAYCQNAQTLGVTPTREDFIQRTLAQIAQTVVGAGITVPGVTTQNAGQVPQLSNDQLAALYDFCTVDASLPLAQGRLNINTASDETLEYVTAIQETERDAIILYRDQNGGEITSIVDLLNVPQISRARLAALARVLTTQSTVFVVTSRGRDATTGLQVEMTAEVERSAWPITVRSLTVR